MRFGKARYLRKRDAGDLTARGRATHKFNIKSLRIALLAVTVAVARRHSGGR